jgi:4-amino-4-deoxy-L-arabinose transferase-like glycosyltransferase
LSRTLGAILLLAAALRLLYFTAPPLDAHSFRQIDTFAMARNFHERSFARFDPMVDWGGRDGYLEAEWPAIPALVALLYGAFGVDEMLGRVVVLPFGVALVWCVYRLALLLDGRESVARGAAFLIAVSPAAVFFGRVLMPDTPMVCLATFALVAFTAYARGGRDVWLWTGSASLALACLIKLPAIVIGPAIAAALVQGRGWRVLASPRVLLAGALPLIATLAWYWHAHQVFQETGLTFGIFGVQAKVYPEYVGPGPWPGMYSKWSTALLLGDVEFYDRLLHRFYYFLLLPAGFVGAILGAALWRGWGRAVLAVWFASMVVFVLAAGEVHRVHEYYQLPFVVMAAVWFGVAAAPLFDGAWLRRQAGLGSAGVAGVAALVTGLGLFSFYYSGVLDTHFASREMAVRMADAGRAIDAATRDTDLAIVVDDYGIMSPMLLYFSHLKGWSFDPVDVTPEVVENLRGLGAHYFITTRWGEVAEAHPDTAVHLERFPDAPVDGAPGVRVIRLR